jgi:molybdate transport system substrate-binding protein
MPGQLHLVGSIPLDTPQEVFETFGAPLAKYLVAMPDGEVGPRRHWISRVHYQVLARLGIAAEMAPKARLAAGGPNGRVSVLVSSGQAEIGLQQVSELMSNPGVEVIGMLPPELQQTTICWPA